MANQWADFQCEIHDNILTQALLEQFKGQFPAVYFEAQPMAEFLLAVADKQQQKLVMLPFDYVTEGLAMGAKVTGFDDVYGLRADGKLLTEVKELAALPKMNFDSGRLAEILKAVTIIKERGYTPCLNLSGFLAIGDLLLSIEKIFMAWRREKEALFAFYQSYSRQLTEFAARAFAAGAQVISYSDPLSAPNVIGPKMAREIGENLLAPLLRQLTALPYGGVIHVCGISTGALVAGGQVALTPRPIDPVPYQQAIIAAAAQADKPELIAYGCLNRQRIVGQLCYGSFVE